VAAKSGYDFLIMDNGSNERKKPPTYWIGEGGGWLLRHVVSGLAATGITPNMFTFLGLAVNSWAAALFAMGMFRQAAAVLFLAGFLDMADGQVARRVGRVTAFGAFLDSTLDRYSDLALYMGLVVHYTLVGRPFYMALAAVAAGWCRAAASTGSSPAAGRTGCSVVRSRNRGRPLRTASCRARLSRRRSARRTNARHS